jgi:hypothetical protein
MVVNDDAQTEPFLHRQRVHVERRYLVGRVIEEVAGGHGCVTHAPQSSQTSNGQKPGQA